MLSFFLFLYKNFGIIYLGKEKERLIMNISNYDVYTQRMKIGKERKVNAIFGLGRIMCLPQWKVV